jgi:hypothetical protein
VCPFVSSLEGEAPEHVRELSTLVSGERAMRKNIVLATLCLVFLFGGAATSSAQVKQVKMHIAGYLCGN